MELRVDENLPQSERVAWLGYAFIRACWQFEGRYQARFEPTARYRPTFEEHFEATSGLLQLWEQERLQDSTLRAPELDRLLRIASEGYLGEYVLLEELAADSPEVITRVSAEGLLRLREYIDRYVLVGLPL